MYGFDDRTIVNILYSWLKKLLKEDDNVDI